MLRPQTGISNDIIERLNALHQAEGPLDVLEERRILRKIESLKKVDLSAGLMTYGVFYALKKDVESSFSCHDRSLSAAGRLPVYLMNYAVTCANLNYLDKSYELFSEALHKDPANSSIVIHLARLAFYTCRVWSFFDLLSLHMRAANSERIMDDAEVISAIAIRDDLERLQVEEQDAKRLFRKVERVLQDHNVKPFGAYAELMNCGGHQYLALELSVKAAGDKLAAMNEELAELIADDMEVGCWNKLLYSFVHSSRKNGMLKCNS